MLSKDKYKIHSEVLMGRKPRIEFNGALYHVIQRGNNKEYIFKNNKHKQYFLSKLKEYKDIMNFEVYGYVIMDNLTI